MAVNGLTTWEAKSDLQVNPPWISNFPIETGGNGNKNYQKILLYVTNVYRTVAIFSIQTMIVRKVL